MTPHKEVEGEVPLEEDGVGRAPRGVQGQGQKQRSLTDLGVSSSRPSSSEQPPLLLLLEDRRDSRASFFTSRRRSLEKGISRAPP
ncbi:hypothetical protein ZWY2020_021098 [Hordeum vulgare]|nr:hypothetical protein ZWY2020_021098 [Hordeum vulgare]